MTEHFVDDVRLGRVERLGRMAHVLGRVEGALGQRAIELAQRNEPCRRHVVEAGDRAQVLADEVEARHAVGRQVERLLGLEELADRKPLVLGGELAADGAPHLLLVVVVLDGRRGLARLPGERQGGDVVAALAVDGVVRARMVVREVDLDVAVLALCDR